MSDNIKVNFMISESSKEILEQIKKRTKFSNSAIVDMLLQFNSKSAEFFLTEYQNINNFKDYNYISLDNGGLIFNASTVNNIAEHIPLINDDARKLSNEIFQEHYYNQDGSLNEKEIFKELDQLRAALLSIHRRQQDLEKEFKNIKD